MTWTNMKQSAKSSKIFGWWILEVSRLPKGIFWRPWLDCVSLVCMMLAIRLFFPRGITQCTVWICCVSKHSLTRLLKHCTTGLTGLWVDLSQMVGRGSWDDHKVVFHLPIVVLRSHGYLPKDATQLGFFRHPIRNIFCLAIIILIQFSST